MKIQNKEFIKPETIRSGVIASYLGCQEFDPLLEWVGNTSNKVTLAVRQEASVCGYIAEIFYELHVHVNGTASKNIYFIDIFKEQFR